MEEYYSTIFLIMLLLQEHFEDTISTLLCFCIVYFYEPFKVFMANDGFTFFEIALLYDTSCMVVASFMLGSKLGRVLFAVTALSCFWNFTGVMIPDGYWYSLYQDSYNIINLVLMETLVWYCICYSKLKHIFTKIKEKVNGNNPRTVVKSCVRWINGRYNELFHKKRRTQG